MGKSDTRHSVGQCAAHDDEIRDPRILAALWMTRLLVYQTCIVMALCAWIGWQLVDRPFLGAFAGFAFAFPSAVRAARDVWFAIPDDAP